jgi:cell division transport system permease protein
MTWQTARGYSWGRAMRMLGERQGTTLLSVLVAGLALAVPACAFMFARAFWPSAGGQPVAEISAFVTAGTAPADVKALSARISSLEGVAAVTLISREQAWNELQRRSKDAQALPEPRLNALPDILVAEFAPGTAPSAVEAALKAAIRLPRVESVQGDLDWYRRLLTLTRAASRAAVPLLTVVGVLIAAIVLGAVRLAAVIEPRELRVLEQIGAEGSFIRRPFVYAGATILGIAAAIALGLTAAARALAAPTVAELAREFGLEVSLGFPPWPLVVAFIAASVLIGAGAAHYFAVRSIARAVQ